MSKDREHPQHRLVIDAWHLAHEGVGLGEYTRRVIQALLDRRAALLRTPVVLQPAHRPAPPWLQQAGVLRRIRIPRCGHPVLDKLVWSWRVGAYAARHPDRDALFSPAPFWAPKAPPFTAVTYHDCMYRWFPQYEGRFFVRRWMRERCEGFLARCRVVLTVSESAAADLVQVAGVPRERIRVIPEWLPPGYEVESARRAAEAVRRKYGLPSAYWLYVGGYDYRKNVETLIEAYAMVLRSGSAPPLVLAGRIPKDLSKPVCDVRGAIARCRIPPGQILMPGWIETSDMPGLYGGASLFVFPSRHEGFGLPPLEAMGCGCPTVCADNSSLREVVRDADYRFPTGDAQALAAILERASTHPLPMNPGFRRADFDESACLAQYIETFNS